ncbi:type II secretion system F family protein [Puniceicoccaceae bacterium K14]|nr:type II secretion system F family protein [Puniceicoccaceae bacterium K14]
MPKFQFTAKEPSGKERRGIIDASTREAAAVQIKGYGLTPVRVMPANSKAAKAAKKVSRSDANKADAVKKPSYFGPAAKPKAIMAFTRQVSTLLNSGMPLLRCLEVLVLQERNPAFKWVVSQLAHTIRSGNSLSEGMALFPKEFDHLYVNLVRAGEAGGTLGLALKRLANYLEKLHKMKTKLIAAMAYPVVVASMSLIIVAVLMVFVVPKFEDIFKEQLQGEQLPQITQYVLAISSFVINYWYYGIGAMFLLFLLGKLILNTKIGRRTVDWFKLKTPKIGDLYTKIYISRFSRTLGTLLSSGVPILDGLQMTRDVCHNILVMQAVEKVRSRVKDGETISKPLSATRIFPPMVTSMIEVGEETGQVSEMLDQLSEIYEEEVENSVIGLTSVVEPLLIVMLAIVIVFILLALFLPFIKIMQGFAG